MKVSSGMRILIYGQLPPPHHGSNIMTDLFIKALQDLGHEAFLVDKGFSRHIREVNRMKPTKIFRVPRAVLRFRRGLARHRPHMAVFFISSRWMGLAIDRIMAALSRFYRVVDLLYVHTTGPGRVFDSGRIGRGIVTGLFRGTKACLLLDKTLVSETQRYFTGPVHILPNCIEDKGGPIGISGASGRLVRVLFLSNIEPNKGILTLMESIPLVLEAAGGEVEFIIAGPWQDEKVKNNVEKLVKESGIQSDVAFMGPVYGEEKDRLFNSCDIFVFPSRIDTIGLVNLEAMRAGLPVIASDVGGLSGVVVDGTTGFLVPEGDPDSLSKKILRLIRDENLRKRMGEEGRSRFEREFSFEAYRERLSKILNELNKGLKNAEA